MNEPIKVSVVMCTYNGEKYLREQLDSIINQTYPIHEIIIQDDCSTDGTWEIIQEYATRNENFRIYRNETNRSVYHNFFSAFQKVTGEYFAVSDQDDVWLPEKIKIFVEYADKNDALLVYSDSIIADMELKKIGIFSSSEINLIDTLFGRCLLGHSMFVKTSLIANIKNWNNLILGYDYILTISALIKNSIFHINKPLTIWRRHDKTVSNITSRISDINIDKEKSTKICPVKLIIRVLKSLIINEKIPNFSWFFSNYHKVCDNFSEIGKTKNISNFAYWYSKESISGIFKASYYFSKIENKRGVHRLKSFYRPIHYYYQCMTVHYETFRSWH